MKQYVLDCERMRYKDTGLYHYLLNLGRHLHLHADPAMEKVVFFVRGPEKGLFGEGAHYLDHHRLHKFWMPPLARHHVWHTTSQLSLYQPVRRPSLPVVLTIHDLNQLHEDKPAHERRSVLRKVQTRIDRSAAVVCISQFVKDDVLRHCRPGGRPIHVIHPGVNPGGQPQLEPHSCRPTRPFVFCLGEVCRKKNFHTILALLDDPDLEIVIAGTIHTEPEYVQRIRELAASLHATDRVHLVGQVNEGEKAWYFQNCLAFAFPSLAEGFGLPVVEAMRYGKPVFLSDKTALPEVGGGAASYFTDFEPAAMRAVFAAGMARSAGSAPLLEAQAARFTWHQTAKAHLQLYRELAG